MADRQTSLFKGYRPCRATAVPKGGVDVPKGEYVAPTPTTTTTTTTTTRAAKRADFGLGILDFGALNWHEYVVQLKSWIHKTCQKRKKKIPSTTRGLEWLALGIGTLKV